jgi:hypothetical protein
MSKSWTESDFESLSWHDNAVHGIRIVQGEDGCSGDFILDLDHILEWLPGGDTKKSFRFRIAPAELIFYETTHLNISIDYAAASAALTPFSIHQITFQVTTYANGAQGKKWKIEINSPKGEITFESPRFTQRLAGDALIVDRQSLSAEERLTSR